ncbi:hypothetical protein [Methylobacterium cerastii]
MSDAKMSTEAVPTDDLGKANDVLAEWAARSAADSDALVERLAGMGYDVRGKSEEEIAEVLKHPPAKPGADPAP